MPDIHTQIDECIAEGNKVYARCTVTGTNTGSLMGIPATGKRSKINMFDYAKIEDGKIIERLQQGDNMRQMIQLYGSFLRSFAIIFGIVFIVLLYFSVRYLLKI